MRSTILGIALLALTTAFAPFAAANDDVVEQVGDWTVTTRSKPDQPISPLCILSSPGKGARFILSNVPDTDVSGPTRGSARMEFRLPDELAGEADAEIEAIRILVADQFSWSGPKERWSLKRSKSSIRIIAFVDPRIDSLIPPIARGKTLTVEIDAGGQTRARDFDLAGSYSALVAYEKCLADVRWINVAGTSPS